MANSISWFYESAADRQRTGYKDQRSSFGRYQADGTKTFNENFEEIAERYNDQYGVDVKRDFNRLISDRNLMEQYKMDLLTPVVEGFERMSPDDPHIQSVIENVNTFWDTKVKSYTESASIASFLPISTLEFPVLVKQFFSSILNDII